MNGTLPPQTSALTGLRYTPTPFRLWFSRLFPGIRQPRRFATRNGTARTGAIKSQKSREKSRDGSPSVRGAGR